jgi:hypothetical protein
MFELRSATCAGDVPAASNCLFYAPGCGARVIPDFRDGIDTIDLSAFGFGDVEALLARGSQGSGGVVFRLGGGDSLTIAGVHLAQLDASDFAL